MNKNKAIFISNNFQFSCIPKDGEVAVKDDIIFKEFYIPRLISFNKSLNIKPTLTRVGADLNTYLPSVFHKLDDR